MRLVAEKRACTEEKKGLTKPEGMNKLIIERKRQRTERVGKKISNQRETVAG